MYCRELARELSDVRPLIDAYGADFVPLTEAASVLAEWDHLDTANAAFALVLQTAQRTGNAFAFALAASTRGTHSAWCGNFSEAEADARAALHRTTLTGSWSGRRGALGPLVWALTGRGAYDEIDAILIDHGLEHASGSSLLVDGNLLGRAQHPAPLRGALRRSVRRRRARARARGARQPAQPDQALGAARGLATGGRREEGLALAERAVAAARTAELDVDLGIALHSAGLAERGERSIKLLSEAAVVLEATAWRWEHAETLVDLDALTASERRVATMAADGSSIAEIAQGLFVTRKTHLYAAYRKLDVNTRDDLAAALGRGAPPPRRRPA